VLLNPVCSSRRAHYSKLKLQNQLCDGVLALLTWEEAKRGPGIVWPVWVVHVASNSFSETLAKACEGSGSSWHRRIKITTQQLLRAEVTQKYWVAAFIFWSLFIYFIAICEMQFMAANTERQGNTSKLILFHQQEPRRENEVSHTNE